LIPGAASHHLTRIVATLRGPSCRLSDLRGRDGVQFRQSRTARIQHKKCIQVAINFVSHMHALVRSFANLAQKAPAKAEISIRWRGAPVVARTRKGTRHVN
jgi:hypothetical protein